jgi:amino acid adenylation domain-containing protein
LIHELNASRDLSRNPLFQVMFSLEPSLPTVDPAWHLTQMDVDTGATKYDLYLELDERRDAVLARFHYSTDLFDQATIVSMAEHWTRMMAAVARDASVRVSEIDLLSEGERKQVVEEWNQTSVVYPQSTTIQQAFDAQCRRTPDRIALKDSRQQLTFAELQRKSNQLAHYLQKFGARPGMRVAICVERSCDMVIGLLGILKAGASYVPLDPSYPLHRLRFMLEDADPIVIVTQGKLLPRIPANRVQIVTLDGNWTKIAHESEECPAIDLHASDTAYVLYTSGSSGKPKGVEGTHGGALNRFEWMWERYGFEAGEVSCQKTNLGFVDSVWEIFGPLLGGVASVIVPQEALVDPEELIGYLAEHHVTRMVLVPSLLRALLDHAPNLGERLPALKLWSLSGEALTWELAGRFQKACPKARLLNIYGSSEVAADVTWHEVRESAEGKTGLVPIGRPISNTQVYVLDRHGNAVPVGVRGEIYVGGAGGV